MQEEWKCSNTSMIAKVARPKAREHRPVALTNAGYKLFMGVLKERMVVQVMSDVRVGHLQLGFTSGRRLEENLFILEYCVEESYRMKKKLVALAIDFRKAFDSVDRGALVKALMYFKCDPRVIEVIVKLFKGDITNIYREGRHMGEVEVRRGIRQGCTGSPQLFIMVVAMIIEQLLRSGLGFRMDGLYMPVLFYADDGMLLAERVGEAEGMLDILESVGGQFGLEINKEKSYCLVFNGEEIERDQIGGVKVEIGRASCRERV